MYEENQIVHAMRQAGATAVISKTGSAADLLKTIYDTTHRKDPVDDSEGRIENVVKLGDNPRWTRQTPRRPGT